MVSGSLRLAVDIGGTFTDTVLMSGAEDIIASTKTLTTHQNPADGAMEGALRIMTQTGHSLGQMTGFIHGTTLVTNALIERRGATVATVTTEGFRDILEIAYERRYSQYDINLNKPDLLVPRERSFTIRERMSAKGDVLIDMEDASLHALLAELESCEVAAISVCLMHSYANAEHERRLRDFLANHRPAMAVSISSEVSPEAREFDRLCTTVANAYVQPLTERYLKRFVEQFTAEGLTCPILMMTAGGGMCTIQTASRFPIRLVESGPAGGAILAARISERAGLAEVLSFDVGGTTAKLCLIDNAQPQNSRQFEIAREARFIKGSGMPVRIPVIEMIEIGAGGGSIADVDHLGRLTVGPKSAGSEPGPAAFGKGGTEPTVTDSDIVLGFIVPDTFAEGKLSIDPDASRAALRRDICGKLDVDEVGAADGISRIVDESMASAGRMHAVESGKDLGTRTMIAFGGNGPLHASRVARSAGIPRIVIPPNPGVGSAVGFLFAPVSFEIVRSRYTLLDGMDVQNINQLLDDMISEAESVVAQGAGDAETVIRRSAFMRYNGQGHEIEITLQNTPLDEDSFGPLIDAFETEYQKQFSRPVPGMQIEILNWAVRVMTVADKTGASTPSNILRTISIDETRPIVCDLDGQTKNASFVSRETLETGDRVCGPALITEPQTTTFVSADFSAHVDEFSNLVLVQDQKGVA